MAPNLDQNSTFFDSPQNTLPKALILLSHFSSLLTELSRGSLRYLFSIIETSNKSNFIQLRCAR